MKHMWATLLVVMCACNKDNAAGSGSGSASGSAAAVKVATGSAAATPTPPPADWKAGDVVQVQSPKDHLWYEAQIVNAGPAYKVVYTYADTVEDNVDKARMRESRWKKNDPIEAQLDGTWKTVKVLEHNADGSYDVTAADGDHKHLPKEQIRGLRKPKGGHSSAGNGNNSDAPCPGPGLTRRCNGVCVNIQEDNNNCGSCGNACSGGKHCDGHMFCRDAAGNL